MKEALFKRLAEKLDALPNGFPATEDGAELRLLAKLFTPEEAALTCELFLSKQTPEEIHNKLVEAGKPTIDLPELRRQLKLLTRKGLIAVGRTENGLGYGLLPFVVGIYEFQVSWIDAELAQLFEDYYQRAFTQTLSVEPPFHRVVPIKESIHTDIEVRPYESASEILANAKAWGVINCICRLQKKLIGDPCEHPVEVCMILSTKPGAFDDNTGIRSLNQEESLQILRTAAEAGLVHSVSNVQEEITYICNCCTCSCGILRGISVLGTSNVIAWSPFVNQIDSELCINCEACQSSCQFEALFQLNGTMKVDQTRCVGCGVCSLTCEENAMHLIRRPEKDILPVPVTEIEWQKLRLAYRGIE